MHEKRMSLLRLQRRRPTTVTDKHKEFLAELQTERNRLIEERAKHEAKRQEQKARFAARQAEFRQAVNNNEFGTGSQTEGKSGDNSPQYGHYASASAEARTAQGGHDGPVHSSPPAGHHASGQQQQGGAKQRRKGGAQRPAWALTSQQADAVDDADADELLNYFDDLDVENFLEDVDAKAAAAGVSSRLAEVESQAAHASSLLQQAEELWEQEEVVVPAGTQVGDAGEGWEWVGEPQVVHSESSHQEGKEANGAAAGAAEGTSQTMVRLVRRRRRRSKWESEGPQGPPGGAYAGEGKSSDDDDAASVAQSVMSTSSVRSVHSKRSMEALVKREKQSRAVAGGGGLEPVPESPPRAASGGVFARGPHGAAQPQPRIVQHRTGEGDPAVKDLVGTLPYKHLHPGV